MPDFAEPGFARPEDRIRLAPDTGGPGFARPEDRILPAPDGSPAGLTGGSPAAYHCDSGLGIIHLADGRGNRLNMESLRALNAALDAGLADAGAKLLMIRSGEDSFCLGMDLQNLENSLSMDAVPAAAPGVDAAADGGDGNPEAGSADSATGAGGSASGVAGSRDDGSVAGSREGAVDLYADILGKIAGCAKPVIALVEGDVKAGGVGLAAACDIVIASETASWELSEVLFGLVPYNVLPYVFSLRMSPQRFRYLVLSARKLDARQALDFGLADEVYPVEKLERPLKSTLKTMMRAEPGALASAKAFFGDMTDRDFAGRAVAGKDALLEKMTDPAVLAGLAAFSSGEMPEWFLRFRPSGPLSGKTAAGRAEAN